MDTPIFDFISTYVNSSTARLHMPGHKGKSFIGCEKYDITEIKGADSLFECSGIIRESEENASRVFGSHTFYSTEGSSLCIRAMVYLVMLYAKENGKECVVLAPRNVHKTFLSAVALLDLKVEWIFSSENYLSCDITPEHLESYIEIYNPTAVYLTSPDYLGNVLDIAAISKICKKRGVLLLVDNAHGAYLKFLENSLHPCDLGADLCCDSAHKTLPALTGGAYIHISDDAPKVFLSNIKNALSLFASTSPSYLILSSLDKINPYLDSIYKNELSGFIEKVDTLKKELLEFGYTLLGDEPLKITIRTLGFGYFGYDFAEMMRQGGFECEFSDKEHVVLMLTPQIKSDELQNLGRFLVSIERKLPIAENAPRFFPPKRNKSIREAALSPSEILPVTKCLGKTIALSTVSCPPAVPILVCGEEVSEESIQVMSYYGIDELCVIK